MEKSGNITVANPPLDSTNFTNEQELASRFSNEIKNLWSQGKFDHFYGVNNTRINYVAIIKEPAKNEANIRQCLVIVPGRSEGYLKYQELTFDLYQQGYDIFIIDHRGQGISQRLLTNPHKGYVKYFDDYSEDLQLFMEQVVNQHCSEKPYLLAHSMGGLIAARYLQQHSKSIKAAVFSSPMIAIHSGGIPQWLGKALIYGTEQLNQWLSDEPWYFLGQGDVKKDAYDAKSFNNNPLMQSQLRYQQFTQLYQSTAEIQLGGVTVHWLAQALAAEKKVFENLEQLTTPTMVLQAGSDRIVDNEAQNKFCTQLNKLHPSSCPNGKAIVIKNARHELLFESDQYRDQALKHIVDWFAKFR